MRSRTAISQTLARVRSTSSGFSNTPSKAGIKHYFVENDEAKGLDDIRVSYNYLSKLEA